MINYENSMLPKLLAKENITIKHGNYNTAWFDVKERVLGLPLWKDMGKDVYDLLIGHEVGHAINTPYEGWHDSPEKLKGCPRSYINVVEDARIERKIKTSYPGLVGSFQRGYKKLFNQEFFGDLSNVEWSEVKLIDKINLKAKIGSLIDVPFSDDEYVFMDRANKTETFEEVVQLVRDILAWTKENQQQLMEQPQNGQNESESEADESQSHDDLDSDGFSEEACNEDGEESSSGQDKNEEGESEEEKQVASQNPIHDDDVSITDAMFRDNEASLLESDEYDRQPKIVHRMEKSLVNKAVIPYLALKEQRAKCLVDEPYYQSVYNEFNSVEFGFKEYISKVKKSIMFAVKEFEQRKAAHQYQRATTAKTGQIDVNALWSYKTNDDIFLKSTRLADAKSHGMMMLVDYSGSMSTSIQYVIDQVIHTVMFCKAVNIPFEVYGFTSTNHSSSYSEGLPEGHMDMDGLSMPCIISSDLKKSEFEEALKWLYQRVKYGHTAHCIRARSEDWGSTPLTQALIVSEELIRRFKGKHKIEKMNFVTFTDGDANYLFATDDSHNKGVATVSSDIRLNVAGVWCKATNNRKLPHAILSAIKTLHNTNTIGFFMANNNREWKSRLGLIASKKNGYCWDEDYAEYQKEYRKNKCVHTEDIFGYNDYYLVKSGNALSAQSDDFSIDEDLSDNQIGTAFKKYAKNKKVNKVLMTKFGKAVA